jgi:antitoxin ParD1/3/4
MPTRNVNLTDHYDKFLKANIAEGRFSNASEAVRAGLHLLERQQAEDKAKLEWLRGAIQQGVDEIERGEYTTLGSPAEIDRFIDEIHEEALGGSREGV